jgi:hypothetical protein
MEVIGRFFGLSSQTVPQAGHFARGDALAADSVI